MKKKPVKASATVLRDLVRRSRDAASARNDGRRYRGYRAHCRARRADSNAIDWTVAHGEHWVILGANGSGKTSLLSTLTGYMPPTAGDIAVLGETYGRSDWRELRKRIGICSSSIHQLMEGHESRAVVRDQRTSRDGRDVGRDSRRRTAPGA